MNPGQTQSMFHPKRDTGKDTQVVQIASATATLTTSAGLNFSVPYASVSDSGNLFGDGDDLQQSRRVSQQDGQREKQSSSSRFQEDEKHRTATGFPITEKPSSVELTLKRGRKSKTKLSQRNCSMHKKKKTVPKTRKHRTPCQCRDKCEEHCPCVTNKVSCETFCGCPDQCEERYRGCHCATGQCRRGGCPCFKAHRECDPQLCSRCWNDCGIDPRLHCDNMHIRQGRSQEIKISKSSVADKGAFTVKSVKKGTFIGEYTGERITQEAADRQKKEHPDSSYLFDLDEKYVVDARNTTGVLRYVNHSEKPNCYPRVSLVDGEYRIGFFAYDDIEAGTELFINYGRHYAPVWNAITKVERTKEKSVGKRCGGRKKLLNAAATATNQGPPKRAKNHLQPHPMGIMTHIDHL